MTFTSKSLYLIRCILSEEKIFMMKEYRDAHLKYLDGFLEELNYGGVLLNDAKEPLEIQYFLNIEDINIANAFVQNDPYFGLYKEFIIAKFIQKKP